MHSSSAPMYLRKTCRGMGKIYSLVQIPEELRGQQLSVSSCVEDGTEVPAKLLPFDDASMVLILAVLNVAQTVTLVARNNEGHTLATLKRVMRPQVAKMSSQVHTFLRDREMEKIRNYDAQASFGEFDIDLSRVILAPEEIDVVQGEAMCTSDSREYLSEEVEVLFLTRDGRNAALAETIILRDRTVDVPQSNGCVTRIIQFSARIPRSLDCFVIWIRPKRVPGSCL